MALGLAEHTSFLPPPASTCLLKKLRPELMCDISDARAISNNESAII